MAKILPRLVDRPRLPAGVRPTLHIRTTGEVLPNLNPTLRTLQRWLNNRLNDLLHSVTTKHFGQGEWRGVNCVFDQFVSVLKLVKDAVSCGFRSKMVPCVVACPPSPRCGVLDAFDHLVGCVDVVHDQEHFCAGKSATSTSWLKARRSQQIYK